MIRIGLTGSIGMGKSTTAKLFASAGCAVWDADAAVHRLYSKGGAAVEPMRRLFPDAIEDDAVSRTKLRSIISQNASNLEKIEQVVHPLVAIDRAAFAEEADAEVVVFDIPLLFENSLEREFHKIVCVSVDPETQRERVLARGTMNVADFERLLSVQLPDELKREKADYVLITDSMENARAQVHRILNDVRKGAKNA